MSEPTYVGVDGTPDGWLAVRYEEAGFRSVARYDDVAALWDGVGDAATVLVDVPIGLADDRAARAPERRARDLLGDRRSSVFNVPIRPILGLDYPEANERQKATIGKGLQQQTHNIAAKIREIDDALRDDGTDATQDTLREAHPEVCFWALNDRESMSNSKTGQPAAAFWERVAVLETVDDDFRAALFDAGETIAEWDAALSNDDLLDAFALAVTASDLTGELRTLPDEPRTDAEGLRMEMVYAAP